MYTYIVYGGITVRLANVVQVVSLFFFFCAEASHQNCGWKDRIAEAKILHWTKKKLSVKHEIIRLYRSSRLNGLNSLLACGIIPSMWWVLKHSDGSV